MGDRKTQPRATVLLMSFLFRHKFQEVRLGKGEQRQYGENSLRQHRRGL